MFSSYIECSDQNYCSNKRSKYPIHLSEKVNAYHKNNTPDNKFYRSDNGIHSTSSFHNNLFHNHIQCLPTSVTNIIAHFYLISSNKIQRSDFSCSFLQHQSQSRP